MTPVVRFTNLLKRALGNLRAMSRVERTLACVGLACVAAPILALVVVRSAQAVSAPPASAPHRSEQRIDPRSLTAASFSADQIDPQFQKFSPAEAEHWNDLMPVSSEPNPAARPFRLKDSSPMDYERALDCLTAAIHYEAATEGTDGQRAVAQVVLNRVRHPAFPKSVCAVVFQGADLPTGCQFTFTCDGALDRTPDPASWKAAQKVAASALAGSVYEPVGLATHYHTRWVVPYWAGTLTKIGNVGAHIFYRWPGGWGTPPAFNSAYSGGEIDVVTLFGVGHAPFATMLRLASFTPTQPVQAVAAAEPEAPVHPPVEVATPIAKPSVEVKLQEASAAAMPELAPPPPQQRPQHLAIPRG